MKTLTYQQRISLVLRHIENHIDTRLDLEELARIACFSPFHFHRIFSSMIGESVSTYVRRLLLERAAMQLWYSPETVTQIALAAGYDSVDGFTRAFKNLFGLLPSKFRTPTAHRERAGSLIPQQALFYHENPDLPPMNIRIGTFPACLVAAIRHTGAYGDSFPAWERLWKGMKNAGLLVNGLPAYSISYDDPDITAKEKCRMDVCLSLAGGVTEENPKVRNLLRDEFIFLRSIGNHCDYAMMQVKGPYTLLHSAYRSLFGMWFPQSGREPANEPGFEIYHNSPQETDPTDLLTEIYIPLK